MAVDERVAVSVVIPCFNLGLYIDEAVQSVLDQTYQDFEIIIVNDGSTDEATNRVLREYERPRTRVLTTENRGLAAARNLGIRTARGTYVSALDADDRLAPTFLEKAVHLLETHPEIAFASMWLETFGDESWVWRQERCDLPTLLTECTVCTAALVRASALAEVGGFDERMPAQGYEDWDLWITMVERGFQGLIIPEVLFHYRRRQGSMSTICCNEPVHGRLMDFLIEKHRASYEAHAGDVLLRKQAQVGDLLRSNHELERHITTWLTPQIESRRLELERLQQKLRRAETRRALDERAAAEIGDLRDALARERQTIDALALELARTRAEVDALHASKSWKLTAPLRAAQTLLTRLTP